MIAVIMANIDDYFSTEVFRGATKILKSNGYQAFLLDTSSDQKQESILLRKIRGGSKPLIFCLKERWVIEFMSHLITEGFMKNDQVLVTGFADTQLAQSLLPHSRFTSQAPYKMGAIAAQFLVKMLKDENYTPPKIVNIVDVDF